MPTRAVPTRAPPAAFDREHDAFVRDLRARVDAWFAERRLDRRGNAEMAAKVVILPGTCGALYALTLFGGFGPLPTLGLAVAFGAAAALVAFNIPHDALHGAISSDPRVNRALGYAFNLVGIDSYTWTLKHDLAHHGFPNVPGLDPDLDGGGLLRLSPTDPWHPWHAWQHLYAPLVWSLLGFLVIGVADLKLYSDRSLRERYGVVHPRGSLAVLLATKAAWLAWSLLVPLAVLPFPAWQVLAGWVVMHGTIGFLSALVLLPSHCMEYAEFPVPSDGRIPADRALHTLATTLDFAPRSKLANVLLGGFNTNVVHHLIPDVCHVHLGPLTAILARCAADHGLPYHEATLPEAIRSHFRFLREMGRKP